MRDVVKESPIFYMLWYGQWLTKSNDKYAMGISLIEVYLQSSICMP